MTKLSKNNELYVKIAELLQMAKQTVVRSVNQTMVCTYFEIGRMIVEDEQEGKHRAAYGKQVLKELSKRLAKEFGKGFSVDNLQNMRHFYQHFSIYETTSRKFELSWSHYLKLMRIEDLKVRNFYEIESVKNHWSLKELQRQFDTGLFERLALSRNKEDVKQLSEMGQIVEKPIDLLKDPYILEFLDLPEKNEYSENQLEAAIINKLEKFLLELGKGFMFVCRVMQKDGRVLYLTKGRNKNQICHSMRTFLKPLLNHKNNYDFLFTKKD